MNTNSSMDTDEREAYQQAIKSATVAKAFDRILHIAVILAFFIGAGYVIYQQAAYQEGIKKVSAERTRQYERLLEESENLKQSMACLKRLPVQPDEASITICVEKIKGEN